MGSAPPAIGIAVLLLLIIGTALVLYDKRTRRTHPWVNRTALIALSLSAVLLVTAVCLAILDPHVEQRGIGDRATYDSEWIR